MVRQYRTMTQWWCSEMVGGQWYYEELICAREAALQRQIAEDERAPQVPAIDRLRLRWCGRAIVRCTQGTARRMIRGHRSSPESEQLCGAADGVISRGIGIDARSSVETV
jgi:hypothetical protein